MKRKQVKRQNLIQLLITIVIIVLVAFISSHIYFRFDLTSEKRYTLSDNTKTFLKNLDEEVYIKIYLESDDLPISFNRLQTAIKELIDEFKIYAGDNIDFDFVNAFEDVSDKAKQNIYTELTQKGLKPVELKEKTKEGKTSQKIIIPGALVYYKGYELAINLLKNNAGVNAENNLNNSIQSLEYEFTNAIRKLSHDNTPMVAFIEGHGEFPEPYIRDVALKLSEYYIVEKAMIGGQMDSLNKYSTIIFAKPQTKFTERDKFAIDQYLMQGGKILWLIDGTVADMDSLATSDVMIVMENPLVLPDGIGDMLFKYGVRINPELIQDKQCAPIGLTTNSASGKQSINFFPWLYFPIITTQNDHPVTKYLNMIKTEFVSTIDTLSATPDVTKTVLLHSSKSTKLQKIPARVSFSSINREPDRNYFNRSNKPIAVLLEGQFESLYKNRLIPGIIDVPNEINSKSVPTKMIVVADGDIIRNEVSVKGEILPLGFDRQTQQTYAGNAEFIMNAVNYLCDDEGMMNIRSREIKLRLLNKLKAEDERFFWQMLNTIVPLIFIIIFGIVLTFIRKRRYCN